MRKFSEYLIERNDSVDEGVVDFAAKAGEYLGNTVIKIAKTGLKIPLSVAAFGLSFLFSPFIAAGKALHING